MLRGCLGSVGIGWRDMEWEVSLILKGVHRLGERHRYGVACWNMCRFGGWDFVGGALGGAVGGKGRFCLDPCR